jgi:glycerol dehydrogenase
VGDGYQTTLAAMALSELCYATLMAKGVKAYQDVVAHRLTQDVEDIIEVNTLLSGIGVESAGCAAAHALNSGFSALPECQDASHGEIVAFGTLCELVLEDWPRKTIHQVMDFNLAVGLPVTLADIGLSSDDKARLARVAQKAFTTKHIAAVPKATAPEVLVEAILRADRLGRSMRTRLGQ